MIIIKMNLTLIVLFVMVTTNMLAQESQFTVIAKSGEVYLLNNEAIGPTEIQVGDKLESHHQITIGDHSYFSLVDSNLQTLEITKKGNYRLTYLDSMLTNKSNSVTKKFTQLILDGMASHEEKYKEMKTLGAVVRKSMNKIDVSVPDSSNIDYSEYKFSWYPTAHKTKYIYKLFNPENKTIFMNEVNDTSITIDLTKFTLQFGVNYNWVIQHLENLNDSRADTISFTIIAPIERKKINEQLKTMKNDFIKDSSAFNNFVIAKFLRSKRLYDDAFSYYRKAIDLAPNVNFYWYEYLQFLLDIGLQRKALDEWSKSTFNKPNNTIGD